MPETRADWPVPKPAQQKYFTKTATVEVGPDELRRAGWHHRSECSAGSLSEAIVSLHRQAHPGENPEPLLCRDEPCRSLSYGQIRGDRP